MHTVRGASGFRECCFGARCPVRRGKALPPYGGMNVAWLWGRALGAAVAPWVGGAPEETSPDAGDDTTEDGVGQC